jgi:hypothetical protein
MSGGLDIGPNEIAANRDGQLIRQVPDQHAVSFPRRPDGRDGAGSSAGTSLARRNGTLAREPKTGPGRRRRRGPRHGRPGPCPVNGPGRSTIKRTSIGRRTAPSERPRPGALSPEPPDPDIVLAKALARTALSGKAPGT